MALATRLYNVVLAHVCPHCGNRLEKPGKWFWRMRQYICEACRRPVRLTYDDKMKLFDEHAHLNKRT